MAVTGSLTVFITDKTLLMKAKNSEELSLDLSFAIDEGNKLTFSVPEVQLSYNGPDRGRPHGDQDGSEFFGVLQRQRGQRLCRRYPRQ